LLFQENSTRTSRCFLVCFNTTPDFAANFHFQKSKGSGEFAIKYMLAAFNKEADSGKFFIEFEDKVWTHKLIESFQQQGASQALTITFQHNDGDESAANALACIMASQKKTGDGYVRGTCPPALYDKAHAKMMETQIQEQQATKEFDEKTAATIKLSLEDHAVKLEAIGNNVQSYGVKMETGFEDVKQEVRSFIPDFQERIKQLEKEVDYHKTQRDVQEGKTAAQTTKLNKLKEVVTSRDDEIAALVKREEAHVKREEGLLARIKEVENAIHVSKLISSTVEKLNELIQLAQEDRAFARAERAELKQSIAEVQETAKTLGDMLSMEEERAAKRPRA
jgi:hypothetical protein